MRKLLTYSGRPVWRLGVVFVCTTGFILARYWVVGCGNWAGGVCVGRLFLSGWYLWRPVWGGDLELHAGGGQSMGAAEYWARAEGGSVSVYSSECLLFIRMPAQPLSRVGDPVWTPAFAGVTRFCWG